MYKTNEKLHQIDFKHLPKGFDVTDKTAVYRFFDDLCSAKPVNIEELKLLILKYSDVIMAMEDELAWRYIRMTLNADNEDYENRYNEYFSEIYAPLQERQFQIKKLMYDSPYRNKLAVDEYQHLIEIIENDIKLFREENIPLIIQESELANKYGGIVSQMSVFFDDEEKTPAKLSVYLKDKDRKVREQAWRLLRGLYMDKAEDLDKLYDELAQLRYAIAQNTGFENYRDYKHQSMGRFSYTPEDIYAFHDAVEKEVIPFIKELDEHRRQCLGVDTLRPWDTSVDLDGRKLKPFETTEEFVAKTLQVLEKVNPEYANQLEKMHNTDLLDLENRKGKAPGGYNSSIRGLASSFIFMNHVKMHSDLVTLLHEAGHAMHSTATKDIAIAQYLDTPSDVAELASMTMEFLSMDYWDIIYPDPIDLKKAKKDQLEGALSFLPWCMTVDAFQHWVYLNPKHSAAERNEAFVEISKRFSSITDWTGLEEIRKHGWKMQLHIFEVPFYYIEYGMAQLGALSIYKNFCEDKEKTLRQYQDFLNLGYSVSVRELYQAAGIEFDFSETRIRELVGFVRAELAKLERL